MKNNNQKNKQIENLLCILGLWTAIVIVTIAGTIWVASKVYKPKTEFKYVGSESLSVTQQSYNLMHYMKNEVDECLGNTFTLLGVYTNSLTQGDGTVMEPEDGQTVYHFLTVLDDYGDCSLTIEFTTANDTYPDVGSLILITGVMEQYLEDGNKYYTLRCDNYTPSEESSITSGDSE